MKDGFVAGVVEGFYGQMWTREQRLHLLTTLAERGLNTYFYAPKDDLKHRAQWRELYDSEELASLAELVSYANERGVRFVYGLSPGLDMVFSSADDFAKLTNRLSQLMNIGVRDFALLFDDLPGVNVPEDAARFPSVAAAHAAVTNDAWDFLQGVGGESLLFCPTPYCDRMVSWKLGGEDYLDVVGERLQPDVGFLWTGPEIISRDIPTDSVRTLRSRIGRGPVLWDNLHANDYDMRRLFCGPYQGRSADLLNEVQGILVNPNNEYWINFIPLVTLGQYLREPAVYEPYSAFQAACHRWVDEYETVGEALVPDDLQLLAECYYLPYTEGPRAEQASACIEALLAETGTMDVAAWEQFEQVHHQIDRIFTDLTRLKNRELFYAWSRRIWELKEELDLIRDFLRDQRTGRTSRGFRSETHLPGTCRGGMVARLQARLRPDGDGHWHAV